MEAPREPLVPTEAANESSEGLPAGRDGGPELEQTTRACLQGLRTARQVACGELLRVVDGNRGACEAAVAPLAARSARLRALLAEVADAAGEDVEAKASGAPARGPAGIGSGRTGARDQGAEPEAPSQGLFGELLSTFAMGLAAEAALPSATIVPEPSDARPRRAVVAQEDARLLAELEDLERRLEKLRACWPCLREAICRAYEASVPLETASLVWTLREVLNWRRSFAKTLDTVDTTCERLWDGLERERERHVERMRWRGLAQGLLSGLEPQTAARAAAALWIRGPNNEQGGAEAREALGRGLEAAAVLEQRLRRVGGAVLRAEAEPQIARRAARRLARVRRRLLAASDDAALVSGRLAGDAAGGEAQREDGSAGDAAVVLWTLTRELRRVAKTLHGAPGAALRTSAPPEELAEQRVPAEGGTAVPLTREDIWALRAWVRSSLLRAHHVAAAGSDEGGEEECKDGEEGEDGDNDGTEDGEGCDGRVP